MPRRSRAVESLCLRKGAWTNEEDTLLKQSIGKYGEGNWHRVPLRAGLNRCRKSCRLRWLNYLHPDIKRGQFEADEVDLINKLHRLLGNRWSLIAGRLPGRTANDVKNFWNTHLNKKSAASTVIKAIRPQPLTFSANSIWLQNSSLLAGVQKQRERSSEETAKSSSCEDDSTLGKKTIFMEQEQEQMNEASGSRSGSEEWLTSSEHPTTKGMPEKESATCSYDLDDLLSDVELWALLTDTESTLPIINGN